MNGKSILTIIWQHFDGWIIIFIGAEIVMSFETFRNLSLEAFVFHLRRSFLNKSLK